MKNTNTSLRVITLKIFFRPVFNESEPINVTFGLNLQQIVDLVSFPGIMQIEAGDNDTKIAHFLFYQDEKNQLLTTCMWFNLVRNLLLRKNKGKALIIFEALNYKDQAFDYPGLERLSDDVEFL